MTKPLRYIVWPLLFALAVLSLDVVVSQGYGWMGFNLLYLGLAVSLAALEWLLPYEQAWRAKDRELGLDIGHTLLTKGGGQVAVVTAGLFGLAQAAAPEASGLWPSDWPQFAQILLGLLIADFGLYWAHRLAHDTDLLWRFHVVHHSVRRLWFFNTGRFHFFDGLVSLVLSQPLLYLFGAPSQIFMWVAGITAIVGLLTHCNVDMRTGPLDYLFNTPRLHRWHHSRLPAEGNKNYGENLVLWDFVFGSYFNPNRRPPVDIGTDHYVPVSFLGQLSQPFKQHGVGPAPAEPPCQDGAELGERAGLIGQTDLAGS